MHHKSMVGWFVTALMSGSVLSVNFSLAQESFRSTALNSAFLQSPNVNAKHIIDSGDVLAIYVEGVLGKVDEMPPVNIPDAASRDFPSIGYPVVVRESGSISLPLISPIYVRGLDIKQTEDLIKKRFLEAGLLKTTNRILVSLMRKRTVSVTVIRGDQSQSMGRATNGLSSSRPVNQRSDGSQIVEYLQLPIGDNDLLNALSRTGGLPGLNAKPEVRILREYDARIQIGDAYRSFSRERSASFPRSKQSRGQLRQQSFTDQVTVSADGHYRAPNESGREFNSTLEPNSHVAHSTTVNDPRLTSRDIVIVEARPTEVYHTGGLLVGGEHPIPRDKPLDVLEAVAISQRSNANSGGALIPQLTGTELLVVRKTRDIYGQLCQVNYRIDIRDAYQNPNLRMQVLPGDILILRYSARQRIGNVGIGTLNTYALPALLFSN